MWCVRVEFHWVEVLLFSEYTMTGLKFLEDHRIKYLFMHLRRQVSRYFSVFRYCYKSL